MSAPVAPAGVSAAPRPQLWRITDRSSFQELRRHGRRAGRGPVSVTWAPPAVPGTPPRVGFTVGKAVGGATTRNLVKRRLRAGLHGLHRTGALPSGTYVIGASADIVSLDWSALSGLLDDAVTAATGGRAA